MEIAEYKGPKPKKYKWTRDKKILGLILGSVSIVIFVFSFLKLPVISSINAYTLGMLLGWHSAFVYAYLFYVSANMLFDNKLKVPSWFKLNNKTYLFIALSVIFISVSSGYYQTHTNSWTKLGSAPVQSVSYWWNDVFTNSNSAWKPKISNGGVLGAVFYLVTASASTGIGALTIAIILLTCSISVLATGTISGLYKNINAKRKAVNAIKNIKEIKIKPAKIKTIDLKDIDDNEVMDIVEVKQEEEKEETEEIILPFDEDVFND